MSPTWPTHTKMSRYFPNNVNYCLLKAFAVIVVVRIIKLAAVFSRAKVLINTKPVDSNYIG